MKINKKILAVAVIVLIIIGLLASTLLNKPEKETPLFDISSNASYPWLHGDDVYYFTGTSFVKYNVKNNKTTRLGNYIYNRSQVANMKWSESSAIFMVTQVANNDIFAQSIAAYQPHGHDEEVPHIHYPISSPDNHWWRYDFATGQLQLLLFDGADQCMDMYEKNGTILCAKPYRGSKLATEVLSFNINSGELKTLFIADYPVSNLSIEENTIYYTVSNLSGAESLLSRNLQDSKDQKVIYESKEYINSYAFSPDNKLLMIQEVKRAEDSNPSRGHDHSTTHEITHQKILLTEPSGKPITDISIEAKPGNIAVANQQLFYYSIDGTFVEIKDRKLIKSHQTITIPPTTEAIYKNEDKIFIVTKEGNFYTSKINDSIPLNTDTFTADDDNTNEGFYIDNPDDENVNNVYLYNFAADFTANTNTVDQYLRSLGYDPNLFTFNWIIDSTGNTIPLGQTAVVLSNLN